MFQYVQALGRLDYQRDPYVQRKLRDILCHYMTRFPVVSNDNSILYNVRSELIEIRVTATYTYQI